MAEMKRKGQNRIFMLKFYLIPLKFPTFSLKIFQYEK